MAEQLNFLDALPVTGGQLDQALAETRSQVDNVRRGLFKRYGELNNELDLLRDEIVSLRKQIEQMNKLKNEA